MGISTAAGQMTSEEIVALSREHTFFSWSAQGAIDPIAIDRAFDLGDQVIGRRFHPAGADADVQRLLRQLVTADVGLISFAEKEPTLEDVFMMVTKGLVT